MADAEDKGQEAVEEVQEAVTEEATERTPEQTAAAEEVALKIGDAAVKQAEAPKERVIVLVTDGNVVTVPRFTMQLLEAKQALQMALVGVDNQIRAKAADVGKSPEKVVVDP